MNGANKPRFSFSMPDFEDKDLLILCVTVLCILALFNLADDVAAGLIEKALYGLFGIVTGRAMTAPK